MISKLCRVLRFGNHDRLPDPVDCQKYYTCTRGDNLLFFHFFLNSNFVSTFFFKYSGGQPRLGVCPQSRKTVFNPATGQCDGPEKVPGWYVNFKIFLNGALVLNQSCS